MNAERQPARALLPRTTGAALLLLAALIAINGFRIGLAQWLVFAPDVPGVSPTGSPEAIRLAAKLTPHDGALSLWVARQAHRDLLAGLLSTRSEVLAERATKAAGEAVRDRSADSYARIHLARVLLDRAALPRASTPTRAGLVADAGHELSTALGLFPSSSDVAYRVSSVMLSHWAVVEAEAARSMALGAIRRVGGLDRLRFPGLLERLSGELARERVSPEPWFAALREATPDLPNALGTLATLFRSLASDPPDWVHESWALRARRASASAAFDAAHSSGYRPGPSLAWIQYSEASLPGELARVLVRTRSATEERPAAAGAWLARAWAARASKEPAEARDAAERAHELARTALVRDLEPPATIGDTAEVRSDQEMLDAAERFIRGMRGAERATQSARIAAIDYNREALARVITLLEELRSAEPGVL